VNNQDRQNMIRQQLDACRPGSDDQRDFVELNEWLAAAPENELLMKRYERLDEQVSAALQDLPVPQGLANRLKRSVASHQNAIESVPVSQTSEQHVVISPEAKKPIGNRRRLMLVMGGFVAVAAIAWLGMFLSGWFQATPMSVVSAEEFGREVLSWDASEKALPWRSDESPSEYPLTKSLVGVRDASWKPFANRFDANGIVYDLAPAGEDAAFLFVMHRNVTVTGLQGLDHPIYSTSGKCVSAFEENGLVYVLVVEGDAKRLRRFVRQSFEAV
jgi:hypothetical protein